MTFVYLCDDEPVWLERLHRVITEYQIKSDWDLQIAYQSMSPESMLNFLAEGNPAGGIYFLDINYKATLNGLELAKHIRELDPRAYIIFVTVHKEMAIEAFHLKLSILDYIIKDISSLKDQVHQCLEYIEKSYLKKNKEEDATITICTALSFHRIKEYDIYFIESIKNTHKVCMHLQSQVYQFSDSLSSLRERLGKDFMQCNKNYLVNIRHIQEVNRSSRQIFLDNGESCFCSVREWKHLIRKLTGAS